jgi:hypothetical protein
MQDRKIAFRMYDLFIDLFICGFQDTITIPDYTAWNKPKN